MNSNEDMNFYFWLGAEGEAISVLEEEFQQKQEEARKNLDEWLNVGYISKGDESFGG